MSKWYDQLMADVGKFWCYTKTSKVIGYSFKRRKSRWFGRIYPVYQEIFGGEHDGEKTWSEFIFLLDDFMKLPNVKIKKIALTSKCEIDPVAKIVLWGSYKHESNDVYKIYLEIYAEPDSDSDIMEIINHATQQVTLK